jgi:hypothetical protein
MMGVARQVQRPGFGLGWIAANTAGYALAFAVWEGASQPIWPALSGFLAGSLTLALYGAALGVSVSLAQALILRLRGARAGLWIAATTVGFALGFAVAAWVALVVSQNSATDLITDAATSASNRLVGVLVREFAVNIPFGLVIGASVGVARWLVLRGSTAAAVRWIPVSAVAFMLGFGTAVGLIQLTPTLPAALFGALFGGFTGAITGLVEWLWLRRRGEVWAVDTSQSGRFEQAGSIS